MSMVCTHHNRLNHQAAYKPVHNLFGKLHFNQHDNCSLYTVANTGVQSNAYSILTAANKPLLQTWHKDHDDITNTTGVQENGGIQKLIATRWLLALASHSSTVFTST